MLIHKSTAKLVNRRLWLHWVCICTPLPGLPALEARGVITGAPLHAASAAGPGQSVREGGCGHRIQEGRLLETWAGPGGGIGREEESGLRGCELPSDENRQAGGRGMLP